MHPAVPLRVKKTIAKKAAQNSYEKNWAPKGALKRNVWDSPLGGCLRMGPQFFRAKELRGTGPSGGRSAYCQLTPCAAILLSCRTACDWFNTLTFPQAIPFHPAASLAVSAGMKHCHS